MATTEQDGWLKDVIGYAVQGGRPDDGGAPSAGAAMDEASRKSADKLSAMMGDGQQAPAAVQKALDALGSKFGPIESEMNDLMAELDNDDLGAIDRAAALSRLGDLRTELGGYMSAVTASLETV